MKQVILGTAGHIDHGKTSLIKALTGIDTDRLKEEKERGITIELGFAHFTLPSGTLVGIVDVPGHERFVHHMVSGATGMDVVALIVAADEGVMPQTIEHLDICKLLNIPRGLIVITKIDLVDDEDWIELVKEDIREAVKNSFLENAPIICVSSVTGEGLDELRNILDDIAQSIPNRSSDGPFRLPVDRVFSLKGFGTIVTGTSDSGILTVGDLLHVYPKEITTRARSIQVHGFQVEQVGPGCRTAINLQGIELHQVRRGDVIAPPDSLIPTTLLDVEVKFLPSLKKTLKHGSKVRVHTGTAEILATVALLEKNEVEPGESTFAQLILDEPVAVLAYDRFVLRSYSPIATIGGGIILNPIPKKHRRKARKKAAISLKELMELSRPQSIPWHIYHSGFNGINIKELQVKTAIYDNNLRKELEKLEKENKIHKIDPEKDIYVHNHHTTETEIMIVELVKDFHKKNPLKRGISKELLFARLPVRIPQKLFNFVLERLSRSGIIVIDQDLIRSSDHKITLGKAEKAICKEIEKILISSGLKPPHLKDITAKISGTPEQQKDVISWMINDGILVKVKDDLIFHRETLMDLKVKLINYLTQHGEISPSQFKELAGISRKYAIPLLEYFDREKVTLRVGDFRKLRLKHGGNDGS